MEDARHLSALAQCLAFRKAYTAHLTPRSFEPARGVQWHGAAPGHILRHADHKITTDHCPGYVIGALCCSLQPLLVPRKVYKHSCVRMLRERIPRTCHHASCHDVLQGACRTGMGRATPMTCCTWDIPSRMNGRIAPSTLASIRTTTPSHWRSRTRPRHAPSAQHPIIIVALQPPWPCRQMPLCNAVHGKDAMVPCQGRGSANTSMLLSNADFTVTQPREAHGRASRTPPSPRPRTSCWSLAQA